MLAVDGTLDVEIYTPDRDEDFARTREWAPVITFAPRLLRAGESYQMEGIRLNGIAAEEAHLAEIGKMLRKPGSIASRSARLSIRLSDFSIGRSEGPYIQQVVGRSPQYSRGRWAEAYWGAVGNSASGWDIRAERSMAMAA